LQPPARRKQTSGYAYRAALGGVHTTVPPPARVRRPADGSVSGDSLRDRNSTAYGAAMYPPPSGTELTVDQAREPDDTLSSDPFQYFRSRIASLMAWQETAPVGDRPLSEAARAVSMSDRSSTPICNVRRSTVGTSSSTYMRRSRPTHSPYVTTRLRRCSG
jgi:hypothetical protein